MQYIFRQPLAILLPAFALLLTLPGCGGLGKWRRPSRSSTSKWTPNPSSSVAMRSN